MLWPVLDQADIKKALLCQQRPERLRLMDVFHMLLTAAAPELAAPLKEVHAVDDGLLLLVQVGPPETEQILLLVHEDLPIQGAEPFRFFDVKEHKTTGTDKEAQTPEQLRQVNGVGVRIASLITSGREIAKAYQRTLMAKPDMIGNSRDAEKYCLALAGGHRNEHFYVIALNAQCKVIGRRKISEGSLSEVSAYPRLVLETALNYNAHSILLCHNHPGGTCAPSQEDIASTLQLQRLLNGVGILVLDHIIVANASTYSMIEHQDIDYRIKNRI